MHSAVFFRKELIGLMPRTNESGGQSPPHKRQRTEKTNLFAFMDEDPTPQNNTELDLYLSESSPDLDADPLTYWKVNQTRFPGLSALAKKYLCVPASSAPVERVFSSATKVNRPDRNRLTDMNFETLIYNKVNHHLL